MASRVGQGHEAVGSEDVLVHDAAAATIPDMKTLLHDFSRTPATPPTRHGSIFRLLLQTFVKLKPDDIFVDVVIFAVTNFELLFLLVFDFLKLFFKQLL